MHAIKCLIWDLDDTLWTGILLEGDPATLRPGAREALEMLDQRGIVQSIASRNDPDAATAHLLALGVDDYFLCPQIHWGAKSESIATISKTLGLPLDSIAFIDDQPFERDEVLSAHPDVLCLDSVDLTSLVTRAELTPRVVSDEARQRRHRYREELARTRAESEHLGPREDFLAGLGMRMRIFPARPTDLARAEELTERTHQLNSTGRTFSRDQLAALASSDTHRLVLAALEDRYGNYGTVGLALVACANDPWVLELLLMSCRVLPRGVGGVLLAEVRHLARAAGVRLRGELVDTGRNRMMLIAYRMSGFVEVARDGAHRTFEESCTAPPPGFPAWLAIERDR